MSKYIDYDAARAERKKEPVVVKIFGEEWELPSSLPAEIVIEAARMMEKTGPEAEIENQKVAGMMARVVPKDILDQWCERGLDAEDYNDLLITIIRSYMGKPGESPQGSEQGEAPAPEAGATS